MVVVFGSLACILFLTLVFVAVVYYDIKRMGRLSFESIFLFGCFAVSAWYLSQTFSSNMPSEPSDSRIGEASWWIVTGLTVAGFERTVFGILFHLLPVYEREHERYHTRLREKILYRVYVPADDAFEVVSYSVIFGIWWFVFGAVVSLENENLWALSFGLATEHLIGSRLRGGIQFNRGKPKSVSYFAVIERFKVNIEVYYHYHLIIHPQMCAGFSSPFWDTLSNRNPFVSASSMLRFLSCPLPFVDFLFVDYSDKKAEITAAWQTYIANPTEFEERMLNLSEAWRKEKKWLWKKRFCHLKNAILCNNKKCNL
jgi:hypothetical protein